MGKPVFDPPNTHSLIPVQGDLAKWGELPLLHTPCIIQWCTLWPRVHHLHHWPCKINACKGLEKPNLGVIMQFLLVRGRRVTSSFSGWDYHCILCQKLPLHHNIQPIQRIMPGGSIWCWNGMFCMMAFFKQSSNSLIFQLCHSQLQRYLHHWHLHWDWGRCSIGVMIIFVVFFNIISLGVSKVVEIAFGIIALVILIFLLVVKAIFKKWMIWWKQNLPQSIHSPPLHPNSNHPTKRFLHYHLGFHHQELNWTRICYHCARQSQKYHLQHSLRTMHLDWRVYQTMPPPSWCSYMCYHQWETQEGVVDQSLGE